MIDTKNVTMCLVTQRNGHHVSCHKAQVVSWSINHDAYIDSNLNVNDKKSRDHGHFDGNPG